MVLTDGSKEEKMMIKVTTGYPLPQGCTVRGENVNFSVCVPSGKKCELLLYKNVKKFP